MLPFTEGESDQRVLGSAIGSVFSVTGISIDWGDGTPSTPGVGVGTQVTGTHTYAEAGTYTATVTATGISCRSICVTNIDAPRTGAPTMIPIGGTASITVLEASSTLQGEQPQVVPGGAFSGRVADGSDHNSGGSLSDFGTTVRWGDGSATVTCTPSATAPCVTGTANGFDVDGQHQYTKAGLYQVTTTVVDGGHGVGEPVNTIVVVPVMADATAAVEGASYSGSVGTVWGLAQAETARTAVPFPVGAVTIDWGDGSTTSAGTILSSGEVDGSHTYADEGTYTITLTANHTGPTVAGNAAAWVSKATVTVADAALNGSPGSGNPFSATAGTSLSALLAHVVDTDPTGTVSDLSAGVDWGDGTVTAQSPVAATGGGANVSGAHTYTSTGTKHGVVHVLDDGGATTDVPFTVNVAAPPPPTTTTAPTSGVQGVVRIPNTGADLPIATALLLVASGSSLYAAGRRRR